MAHELIEHHLLLDSKTVRTLALLMLRPGRLTRAYIEGRRVRYVSPLRLYMFSSIAFFLALWLSGLALLQLREVTLSAADQPVFELNGWRAQPLGLVFLAPPQAGDEAAAAAVPSVKAPGLPAPLESFVDRLMHGYAQMRTHPLILNGIFDEWLPRLMILLLPMATLLLALFGLGRGLFLVDHLAFALHGQTMAFMLAILAIPIRMLAPGAPLTWPMAAIVLLWTLLAYRAVYRSGWIGTVLKVGIVGTLYVGALWIGLVALVLWGLANVGGG